MKSKLLAVLVAAVALPVAAQVTGERAQPSEVPTAKVQPQDAKAAPAAKATDKQRARIAKNQNKQNRKNRQLARHKPDNQKKQAPAG